MDPEYGTKRRAVPLLVEDVNQSETSVDVKSINSKMDDLNGKIEALNDTIKSTVPMGCYTHWRYEYQDTIMKGTLNPVSCPPKMNIGVYIVFAFGTAEPKVYQSSAPEYSTTTVIKYNYYIPFPARYDVGQLFIYNENDPAVNTFEVTTSYKMCRLPPYYPLNAVGYTSGIGGYTNVPSAKEFHDTIGTTSSSVTSNTVIGLLKSISNKL